MEITYKEIAISILILLTGLSAGLCFTWTNAVTTGIGKLNDVQFLSAFQQMNRAILNPLFYTVFIGPFFCGIINLYLFKASTQWTLLLLIFAIMLYASGVLLVTIFGNIPLNDMLDQVDFNIASKEELSNLRSSFETRWNRLHLIRTITASLSFFLLILSLIQISKH